jgi:hypothetical protein
VTILSLGAMPESCARRARKCRLPCPQHGFRMKLHCVA